MTEQAAIRGLNVGMPHGNIDLFAGTEFPSGTASPLWNCELKLCIMHVGVIESVHSLDRAKWHNSQETYHI